MTFSLINRGKSVKSLALGWRQITLLGAAILLLVFHFYPLPKGIHNDPIARVLLADKGELLAASIASDEQWRFPFQQNLPGKYVQAVIAFEDRYFYQHPGVNPLSVVRAALGNFSEGRVVSGGSTITMQLARLIRKDPPRTYTNKFIEMLLALKLEWHYSKREILSLYASKAPFGGNTVGIGAASWRYFGRYLEAGEPLENNHRPMASLSWAEAALLAVLPNSPALIHPGRARDKLKAKRDRLLARLYQKQLLTKNEYDLSILEPLPQKPNPIPRLANHLMQTLASRYPTANSLHSTIDMSLQKKVTALAQFRGRQLATEGVHNLSVVVMNNQNMHTVAYIGNVTSAEHAHEYGASVDIASRPRSTGSILKPLLYGLMLDAGEILPNTLIADVPANFKGFTPENFDHQYRGAVPAKEALARSLNIPAVNMLKKYGVTRFHEDLSDMGMTTLFRSAEDYGLSLILGGAEGNLAELTGIYAQLVNNARSGWDKASQVKPRVLFDEDNTQINTEATMSQGAAWLTLEALQEVVRPGTEGVWREFLSSQKIAWKTGTSYGLRDAWAIGSNGKYTVGVWAGNAGGEGVPGLSGFNTAAPTLFHVFDLLGHSQWINRPEFALKELRTCKNDGYLASRECESEISQAPLNSYFQKITPFHQKVQLDKTKQFRVHGGCEAPMNMQAESRFILPPVQEHYWRRFHHEYQFLEPWREDCVKGLVNYSNEMPMDIIYPQEGAKVYIPYELSGRKGKVIFRASHRNAKSKLFWHINDEFIKETSVFHEVALDIPVGWHKLILVDELGVRLERWFKVLDKGLSSGTI